MAYSETIINKGFQDVNPVRFGYEACRKSHHYGPAIRTHWLLHFVVSGKGRFKIGDNEYHLSGGELFVIPPFIETYYEADAEQPWEYIWVGFTAAIDLPYQLGETVRCPNAYHIFESMKQSKNMATGKTEYLCSKIWELFSLLLENKTGKIDYVETAIHMIHSEYMMGITVKEIADRLNLDRTYFTNLFTKRVGVSPKKYLLNHRMEQAVVFLKKYGYTVSVTARSVGYHDIYVFSKMFKKHYGVSPREYIK